MRQWIFLIIALLPGIFIGTLFHKYASGERQSLSENCLIKEGDQNSLDWPTEERKSKKKQKTAPHRR